VKDLDLGVEIVVHPTVREADGLARSSRNIYLLPDDRIRAATLYKSLQAGGEAIRRGVTDGATIQSEMAQVLKKESAITIDYLAVCDPATLEPLLSVTRQAVLLGAIRLGSVRLIDNILVSAKQARHKL